MPSTRQPSAAPGPLVVVLPEHTADPGVMRFLLCAPGSEGSAALRSPDLVEAVLALAGVERAELLPAQGALCVRKRGDCEWRELGPRVIGTLEERLGDPPGDARPPLADRGPLPGPVALPRASDLELAARVSRVLETEVQPYVATHGGEVELIAVRRARAIVRLRGACEGCPGAAATLREHVSVRVRAAVPEIEAIDVD